MVSIALRPSRALTVILIKKVSLSKNVFFFYKISQEVEMPLFWKPEKVVEGTGPSSPEGFNVLNIIRTDLDEKGIPQGGETVYLWANTPSNVVKFL